MLPKHSETPSIVRNPMVQNALEYGLNLLRVRVDHPIDQPRARSIDHGLPVKARLHSNGLSFILRVTAGIGQIDGLAKSTALLLINPRVPSCQFDQVLKKHNIIICAVSTPR